MLARPSEITLKESHVSTTPQTTRQLSFTRRVVQQLREGHAAPCRRQIVDVLTDRIRDREFSCTSCITAALVNCFVTDPESSPTHPSVHHVGGGNYRIDNLLFPRPGWWNVGLVIGGRHGTASVAFNLILPPPPQAATQEAR